MSDKIPPKSGTLDLFGAPTPPPKATPPAKQQTPPAKQQPPPAKQQPPPEDHGYARFDSYEWVPDHLPQDPGPPARSALQQRQAGVRVAPQQTQGPRVYGVAELVRLASRAVEARFNVVWVEGEVSNLKAPGHLYFTLKDAGGQLPVVIFRADALRMKFRPADGQRLRVRGRLTIYAEQGKFQLQGDFAEPAGLGALQAAFEQLKKKLDDEGLFAADKKRALPFLPRRIGVATSAHGAALGDIVRVASRRGPVRILVRPCLVQGEGAAADVLRALRWLERQPEIDVIIIGRGGGSLEDLAAFNDEALARAIAACRVPVISAVGHEVDFTIADFVADRRAATPSQAAELAVPVHEELARSLEDLGRRLHRATKQTVGELRQALDGQRRALDRMLQRSMSARRARLGELGRRIGSLHPRARLARDRAMLDGVRARLVRPLTERLRRQDGDVTRLAQRLHAAMQQELSRRHRGMGALAGKLDALSPLKVLERGYGLVRGPSGHLVLRAGDVAAGDAITVETAELRIAATVNGVDKK